MSLTHKELVDIGKRWLKEIAKCDIVVAEKSAPGSPEICDVIGWKYSKHSFLIECKASRSDFRVDEDKWFRHDDLGMGQTRYYLAPKGIIPLEEVKVGWGLLEVDGNKVAITKKIDIIIIDPNKALAEMPLLISIIRKLEYKNKELRKALKNGNKGNSKK